MRNVLDDRFSMLLTFQVNNSLKETETKDEKKKKKTDNSENSAFQKLLDVQIKSLA